MNHINRTLINKIIKEQVDKLIKESASSKLYHYISGKNLVRLLKANSMKTCDPEQYLTHGNNEQAYIDGKDKRYISFTRNRNAREGYPVLKYGEFGDGDLNFMCRVEIKGDYFNTHNIKRNDKRFKKGYDKVNVKTKPTDWSYHCIANGGYPEDMADFTDGIFAHNGKEWQMQSNDRTWYEFGGGNVEDKYAHPMSQAEDRLTTTSKTIPNANEYITKIDIFVSHDINGQDYSILKRITKYASNLGITVDFYDNINYFNKQYDTEAFGIDGVRLKTLSNK